MVVSREVMDRLKAIGLNSYERKLWIALLSRGIATAGDLSQIAGVPRSRAYDILESLAEKGLVIIQNTKPLRYVAVEPAEGLERIKGKFRRDFEAVIKRVDDLKKAKALDELQTLHQEGIEVMKPGELTGALKGNAIMQQFKTMIKGASSDIAMIMTAKNLEEIYHRYGNMLKEAAASGVDIKIAVPDPHPELVEKFAKFAELRKLDAGPVGRVAIVDGKEMLLGLTDEKTHPTQDVAVWSCSDHAAGELMQPMFELLWEKLEPA